MPPQQSKVSRLEKTVTAALVVAAIVIAVAAIVGKHGLLTYIQVNNRHVELQEELVNLKEENRRLREEIHTLKTDPGAIERVAREDLGMIKHGEVLYRFTSEEPKDDREEKP